MGKRRGGGPTTAPVSRRFPSDVRPTSSIQDVCSSVYASLGARVGRTPMQFSRTSRIRRASLGYLLQTHCQLHRALQQHRKLPFCCNSHGCTPFPPPSKKTNKNKTNQDKLEILYHLIILTHAFREDSKVTGLARKDNFSRVEALKAARAGCCGLLTNFSSPPLHLTRSHGACFCVLSRLVGAPFSPTPPPLAAGTFANKSRQEVPLLFVLPPWGSKSLAKDRLFSNRIEFFFLNTQTHLLLIEVCTHRELLATSPLKDRRRCDSRSLSRSLNGKWLSEGQSVWRGWCLPRW